MDHKRKVRAIQREIAAVTKGAFFTLEKPRRGTEPRPTPTPKAGIGALMIREREVMVDCAVFRILERPARV